MDLNEEIRRLDYPATQAYDATTLAPENDITRNRIESLKKNAPELFYGGESLLDVGTNKGYLPFLFAGRYAEIHAYEPAKEYFDLCSMVKEARHANNVFFHHGDFRHIPIGKTEFRQYDVVFMGNMHHYLVERGYQVEAPWLWLKKAAAICKKTLIIDGPFTMDDPAVKKIADLQGWPPKFRESYCFKTFCDILAPQFTLVRVAVNEGGVRQTAVFSRGIDNICHVEFPESLVESILCDSSVMFLPSSPNRKASDVFRYGEGRYKFDQGGQPDGVLMILNALPQFFAPHTAVMMREGKQIGDIAEWIPGPCPVSHWELMPYFIRSNAALQTVGLVEPQIKLCDYAWHDNSLVSLDVDMMASINTVCGQWVTNDGEDYIIKWQRHLINIMECESANLAGMLNNFDAHKLCSFNVIDR
jgi:hypothetical protein